MHRLEGRVAVVTGAAGGIGRATSALLARRGCDLALVDVNEAGLAETAARVRAAGRRASLHVADVSDRTRMAALPAEVLAEHGHVHVLVNNAGVTVSRPFEEHSLDDLDWIVGINLWGVLLGCRAFLPILRREEEAHVVNLSSMAAFVGMPMQSSYCATKAAVRAFSEALEAELSGSRVGVSSVHPGAVRTGILRAARGTGSPGRDRLTALMERHARPPERVAEAIVRAVERRRFRVVVGAESRLTDWAVRSFPGLPRRLLGWGWRRSGIARGSAPRSG